ncbi:MAG: nucleotide exchange factor GrpE [Candidatus Jorgensenbacteria bacterium]|nr:nucleotide exchange factor GrpE [Candidatus Jorgensenbacteria bacterium]
MEEEKKSQTQNGAPQEAPDAACAKCERERDEYLDGWKRAKADLANYKKDEAQRFVEFTKLSHASFIEDLTSVLDSFNLALKSVPEQDAGYRGLLIIKSQLEDILKRSGLEPIAASPGEKFNPMFHEAVSEVVSPHPEGAIVEEIRKGYLLHGKTLRPTRVVISKGQKQDTNNKK